MCTQMKLIKIHRLRFDIDDHNTKIKKGQVSLDCDNDHAYDMPNVSRYNDDLKKAIQKALGPNEVKSLNNIRTLYRYPNLSLSRDKVAFYCQNNDLKVIRNKDAADIRVISEKGIEKLMEYHWSKKLVTPSKLIKIIENHTAAFETKADQLHCISIIKDIDEDEMIDIDSITRRFYHADSWEHTISPMLDDIKKSNTKSINWLVLAKNLEMFNEFINPTFKWILDENCNKLMSADSVALDDKSFIQIKDMLKGGTPDDRAVAMNLMCNCDIETSKTYLAMLFFHFGDSMKGTKPWNTVGFKALRKGFQKYYDNTSYSYQHSSRYEKLIGMLIEDNALTVPAMEHVLDLLFEDVVKKATGLNTSKAFKLERSSISLTPDFRAKVKEKSLSTVIKEDPTVNDLPF